MSKYWIATFLVFSCALCARPIEDRKIEPQALAELARAFHISEDQDLIQETQRRWLRQPEKERWEMDEISQEMRVFVLNWAKENGLLSDWKPFCKTYDKALILGATTSRMQMRLDYLVQLWKEGVRFKEIVWLTGERPLDARVDGLMDTCANESEAAHVIWESALLPEEIKALPAVFVAVPMKAENKRPNTEDTIYAWLDICKEPCTGLFVSDQPFCGYQFAVVNGALPSAFIFDLVGPGVDPTPYPMAAAVILDCVARWLYQDSKNMQNKHALLYGQNMAAE